VKECCCAQKTACACKQVKECCCVEKTTCPCVKAKEVAACSCSKKAGSACCAAGCEGSCAGKCEECAQVKSVEKKAARTEKQARKAEKQARKAEKQARKARKVSRRESTRGVEEQVTGLLKACYHAVQNEHYEKAADLARQAYALDARRVEGDPVVYKFSLIETCAARRIASPTPECPAVTASNNYPTPVVTHVFVPAYTVTVGEDGLERIGVDFSVPGVQVHSDSGVIGEVMPEEGSFCTTLLKAVAPESCLDAASYLVNLFVPSMLLPDEVDNGSITFGLSTSGDINFQGLAKYKGMVYRAVIHNGFFFAWTTPQPEVE
jgi:hypothetical protein